MGGELKVLILEDVQFDAELMEYELRREGVKFSSERVETEEDFINGINNLKPDVILVDHSLPSFDGISALEIAKEHSPDTPFIFVSGKIGDDFAVDVLKKGATDYVFKNNLSKLVPAVERALKERSEFIERKKAEEELKSTYAQMEVRIRDSENKNLILIEAIPDSMFILSKNGTYHDFRSKNDGLLSIPPDEIIGKNISNIGLSPNDLDLFFKHIKGALKTNTLQEFEYELSPSSEMFQFESRIVKLNNQEVLCIVRDMTEKKRIEDKVNRSLKEKDVLLQEIHHRVKNNLQIVSSLLSLQSRYIEQPESIEIFRDSQSRIKSMALVHEKLYQSGDLTRIDLAEYIPDLVSDLFRSYGVNYNIVQFKINSENISLDINTAIPCGLIINELVTNSIKHAFQGIIKGEIIIELKYEDDYLKMKVQDNGVGFPEEVNLNNIKTLGLQLVISLTKQLDGSIELIKGNGTCFNIIFKEQSNMKEDT
jgi:two-component sensor histidine kinase/CheY-like chemotaxis protein